MNDPTHTITVWTLHSDSPGPTRPKLVMCVLDEEYMTSAHFALFGAGWSRDTLRMERVPNALTNRLNTLVRAHPVLGAGPVQDHLLLVDKPEEN